MEDMQRLMVHVFSVGETMRFLTLHQTSYMKEYCELSCMLVIYHMFYFFKKKNRSNLNLYTFNNSQIYDASSKTKLKKLQKLASSYVNLIYMFVLMRMATVEMEISFSSTYSHFLPLLHFYI
jgi:hypothetical protein